MRHPRPRLVSSILATIACCALAAACASGRPAPPAAATPPADADPALHYVAIGDSVTATGVFARGGWAQTYAAAIDADTLTDLSVSGRHTWAILHAVAYDARYRAAVARADVITVNAGMNDFFTARDLYSKGLCGGEDGRACMRHAAARFAGEWEALVREVRRLNPRARVVALTLYHPLQVFDRGFGWEPATSAFLADMNAAIRATRGVAVADLHRAFNGTDGRADPIAAGYILPDAIHATPEGHALVVRAIEAAAAPRVRAPAAGGGIRALAVPE